jgi:HPt (histidine-containing phosphotransfer) domain-containing protein
LLEEAPNLLQNLRKAIEQQDAPDVEYAAHTLKGSSSILGAKTFAALCFELEIAGRNLKLEGTEVLMAKINQLYPSVVSHFEHYLASLSA